MLPSIALLTLLAPFVAGQTDEIIKYDTAHNATPITGVWSTGVGLVQTGVDFVDVKQKRFNPPAVTGISFSFTDTHFETVEYRFGSNPANPACPNALLLFQHGEYQLMPNGSIIMTPYAPDGLIQTQSPCASRSSTIQQFNTTIFMQHWRIFVDPATNVAYLHLFRFDGAPINKMTFRYADALPHMQPTTTIMVSTPTAPPRLLRRNAAAERFGAAGALAAVCAVAFGVVAAALL